MGNYKSPSQDCLEEKKDKLSIDSPNRFYLDNIITAYKASDKVIDMHTHTNYPDVIEDKNKKFYIGLRFHPESLYKTMRI